MTNFTIKKFIIVLKHGATTKKVLKKFGFDSEEKLFQALRQNASSKADGFIHQLKRNDKLRLKHEHDENDLNTINNVETSLFVESVDNSIPEVTEDNAADTSIIPISKLEMLEQDERDLSDALYALEVKHKRLMAERKEISDSLQATKKELQKLLQKIVETEEKVSIKCERYSSLACQMKELDLEMAEHRTVLSDLRSMIEELKQVVFLVGSSTIEVENAELPSTEPDEVSALFSELLTREQAEELTVREIKTVAQLLCIVREFKHYEVVFENPKMETLFRLLKPTE